MPNSKRPLETTELSYIIAAKVRGEISGTPSGSYKQPHYCPSCGSGHGIKMHLNPEELLELIRRRIA